MKQSIVVISLVAPQEPGEKWYFAALRFAEGYNPKYLFLTLEDECCDPKELAQICLRVESILKDSIVFVFDLKTASYLSKLLKIKYPAEFIDVRELLIIFYPTRFQDIMEEFSNKTSFRNKKSFRSPAHREVRIIWDVLSLCWEEALKADLGFIGKLEEYTRGLSCEGFIKILKKEVIKRYPDRPINTGYPSRKADVNLFASAKNDFAEIPETAKWVEDCFSQGGLLAKSFPGYEDRNIQTAMAKAILQGFNESKDVLIEAGTGTGKSLAYLIPALWWSRKQEEKVIIATHTITLQEQLYFKDLPLLQSILPFTFKKALLKGKNNYLCLKSFYQDKPLDDFSYHENLVKTGILSWIRETETGDFSEISHLHSISPIWRKYGADNPYCQPGECQFSRQCFMLKARKKADEADLIVINHSLLLADIKTNNKVLPEFSSLIIDEAHNIYQTALKQLGFELSPEQIYRLIDNITTGKGSFVNGLKKNRAIFLEVFPAIDWTRFYKTVEEIPGNCYQVTEQARDIFNLANSILAGRLNIRIDEEKIDNNVYSAFMIAVENLINRLAELTDVFNKLYSFTGLENEQLDQVRQEILKNKLELIPIIEGLKDIVINEQGNRVTYLEKTNSIYLKNTLIDIVGILRERIFQKNNCTVLTSATLTVADSFEYFARDIGLQDYYSLKLDSPFDYPKQMLFSITNDIRGNQPEEDLVEKTADFIKRIAEIMDGKTLVLFTSHRYLRIIQSKLLPELQVSGLKVLAQGIDGSREMLLQDFIKNKNCILLGTSSFWEGIDIPGDTLKCVIMTKLPFWPPDSPILEAKARLLEKQGYDPFNDLYLPEAIIRFKQGFGRLIRTKDDKGVVILLDNRILNKRYGRSFLKSLPILSYCHGSSESVLRHVQDWI